MQKKRQWGYIATSVLLSILFSSSSLFTHMWPSGGKHVWGLRQGGECDKEEDCWHLIWFLSYPTILGLILIVGVHIPSPSKGQHKSRHDPWASRIEQGTENWSMSNAPGTRRCVNQPLPPHANVIRWLQRAWTSLAWSRQIWWELSWPTQILPDSIT
jgi:hypothetical protein